jgi:HlyD family secretion protein
MDGGIASRIDLCLPPSLSPVRPRRFRRWWLAAVAVVVVACFCWRYIVPIPLDAVRATPGPFEVTVSGPCLLDALDKVAVSARVGGRIVELPLEQGDVVAVGAPLARLDAPDIVQQVAQTQADAEAARLHIEETKNDLLSARAAFVHAQVDYDRKAALLRSSDASRADYDAARATLDRAKADLTRAEASVQHAAAAAQSAAAAARAMQAQLSDRTVLAPISGIVTLRNNSPGDILTPGASIAELVDPHSVIVSARLDESVMGKIAPGQRVELHFISAPDQIFQGRVLRLGWSVDTTTREFTVDVTPAELPSHWAIGQRATVTIVTGVIPHAIAVPQSALAPQAGRSGVWIAGAGERAHWQPVQLGTVRDDQIEVKQGIAPGDIVLLHPKGLYPWAPIRWSVAADKRP